MKATGKITSLLVASLFLGVLLASCGGGGPSYGTAPSTSPAPGTPLTTLDLAVLNSGGYYFNVHTAAFPEGELRGRITVPAGAAGTTTISTPLSGAEEVPPASTAATGTGTLTVDLGTGDVSSASIVVSGASSAVSAAHIHQGDPGVNGPIVIAVSVSTTGGGDIGPLY
jgi:hypothetical protein